MRSIRCLVGFLSMALAGCASAPKAVPINDARESNKNGIVTYMLPKMTYSVAATWEKRTYVPGPLTPDLEDWLATNAASCTKTDVFDPESLCAWGLEPALTPASSTALQCQGIKGTTISLVRSADPVLTSTPTWDTSQHFAIELASHPFQQSELQVEYSPIGTLGGYAAKSTNLIAETVEKVATEALAGVFLDPPTNATSATAATTPRCKGSPALCAWVLELASLDKERRKVMMGADPKGASALIDDQIKALRALAEGTERTGPFSIRIGLDPPAKEYKKTVDDSSKVNVPAYDKPTVDAALATTLRCAEGLASATLTFGLKPSQAEAEAVKRVFEKNNVEEPALFYRLPLSATPMIAIKCSGGGISSGSRCAEPDGFTSRFPPVVVPQWGPTLALPRTLGWRSGALSAKLDPNTGALTTLNVSSQGSLEASVLNGLYSADAARRAAEQAAGAEDTERTTLERERILLEEQVRICAARRALGQPPGDECPK